MLVSTKGRYALRVLIDLAESQEDGWVPLKDVAERQDISEKYLEAIVKTLVQHNILVGTRGKGGGYRLGCPADQISVGSILRLTEESLAPVACMTEKKLPCDHRASCRTYPVWQHLNELISGYLDNLSLAELMKVSEPDHAACCGGEKE